MAKLPKPKFNLRQPNSKSETLISLVFRYRGKRLVHSTGYSIHPKDWDFKSQRPIQQEGRSELFAIKRLLDDLSTHCIDIFIESNYGQISIKDFKKELNTKLSQEKNPGSGRKSSNDLAEEITFLEFLDLEIEEMKKDSGIRKDTVRMFKNHADIIKKFAQEVRPFNYEDVDWNFRLEFIDWLTKRNSKLEYGNKTLSVLRQFLERARRKKFHANVQYQGPGWLVPKKRASGDKVILTMEELQILADLKLGKLAGKVRDLFLIGAGTGQRYSDYSRYKPENFYTTINHIPILTLISQKTDMPAKIPLNIFPWLLPILEKHNYTSPKISMQTLNEVIKDICEIAQLKDRVFIVDQYMGRKARIQKSHIPKYEKVSSHTCRRSFATNLYRMGYSLAQIMPMTGHNSESQLRQYIGIDSEMNAEEIAFSIMQKRNKGNRSSGNLRVVNY
jgi:integrase